MIKDRTWFTRFTSVVALLLFAGVVVSGAPWSADAQELGKEAPLPRFGVIWPHKLTRSGLPSEDQGWIWLHQQGVRSIVTFRKEEDVDYAKFGFEKVMRLPLSSTVMPTEEQAIAYLRFVQNPDNQPVHIHCAAGKSRTGMMAALVRYSIDGWDMDRALAEAREYRGNDLSDTITAWLQAWAKAHPPGCCKVKP
jgi:protein tyrosine/serine phosphatase